MLKKVTRSFSQVNFFQLAKCVPSAHHQSRPHPRPRRQSRLPRQPIGIHLGGTNIFNSTRALCYIILVNGLLPLSPRSSHHSSAPYSADACTRPFTGARAEPHLPSQTTDALHRPSSLLPRRVVLIEGHFKVDPDSEPPRGMLIEGTSCSPTRTDSVGFLRRLDRNIASVLEVARLSRFRLFEYSSIHVLGFTKLQTWRVCPYGPPYIRP